MAGVTANGFERKTVEEILDEIEQQQRDEISASIDQSSASPIGQLNGIFSSKLSEAWEVLELAYNSLNRSSAEGVALDNVGELTGTDRNEAIATRVTNVKVNVDDGFSAAIGEMVAHVVGFPDLRFTNAEAVSNTSGGALDIVVSEFVAEDTGPIQVNDQTLTVIAETLPGWNSVINDQAGDGGGTILGSEVQSDTSYRQSQEEELGAQGNASEPAIDAKLEAIEGVIDVTVFFNDEDFTDLNGLPPHSVEALVYDGETPAADDQTIAQTLFNAKAAGVKAVGNQGPFTVQTAEGEDFDIPFSRPTLRPVYVEIDIITEDPPANVLDLVEQAIVSAGTGSAKPSRDVYALELKCAALEVAGVIDVDALRLGFAASPVNEANLVIQTREIATFALARVDATDVT